ncbi:MAG: hypothetical protein H5T84_08745 [Thermoleophilia bacterium]|nr:hypothetical protein [Thermoleophilia bacterium]
MSGRSRKLTAVAILLVFLGLSSWGCGAATSETTTTLSPGIETTASSSPTTVSPADIVGTKVEPTDQSPPEFVSALQQGQPVVLLFYVDGGPDDTRVLEALTRLQSEFGDLAFFFYDVKSPHAFGDLSTLLKVNYPPEVILIDRQGSVFQVWNGYVDEGTLNQSLVNLSRR